MSIEQEPIESPESLPGKVYQSAAELLADIDELETRTLRIWGKALVERPSETLPGETYLEIEDNPKDPQANFLMRIHRIISPPGRPSATKFQLDAIDYSKRDRRGQFKKIWLNLGEEDLANWRIEVLNKFKAQHLIQEQIGTTGAP